MAPPSTKSARPGRILAVLAVLIIVMLVGVVGGANAFSPSNWHNRFRVGLGLDLAGGTTVTLKAQPVKGHSTPSPAAMNVAKGIMLSRVNSLGTTGATVNTQGNDLINVSVPGHQSQSVVNLVGTTAQLDFRQVLLTATGVPVSQQPAPAPAPSPSGSPSPSPSPGGKSSSPKASASPSPSASASGKKSKNGSTQAESATSLGTSGQPKASPSPSPSASPSPSPAPAGSPAPSLVTAQQAAAAGGGDASLVQPQVAALFNKLNCADKNWQKVVYNNNAQAWDNTKAQIVSCDQSPQIPGQPPQKYILDVAKVNGNQLTGTTAMLNPNSGTQWQINFSLNGAASTAFGNLTSTMFTKYTNNGTPTSPLDQFAIVLDGKVISAPDVQQPITTGSGQITGNFTQASATQLSNILKYGALPLSFNVQQTVSVSPQLGSTQLQAGLIAAAVGLALVVVYSFLYYRGLGLVSVLSLATSALLTYLSVVLLSRYQHYTLSLAGIAGLIVAIGITADSFVVYFERLRDEVREGKTLRAAIERGWERARRTILVSDTVSFLAAALLYIFAIGDVKGFAYTLGLTTLIDVVVVFLFTKPMVTLLARTKFYGQGHKLSGLDPNRLGARAPWRGSRRPAPRPATGTSGAAASGQRPGSSKPREA